MEILPHPQPAAQPANIEAIIAAVQLPQPDLEAIKSVRSKLASIAEIDGRCKPDHGSQIGGREWRSHHHLATDRILSELGENPSHELAEAAHAAIIRAKFASESCQQISEALRTAAVRASLSLGEISGRVIDLALANLDRDAAQHREAMPANTLFAGDSAQAFERTLAGLRSSLEAERPEAARDPQYWLWTHGIGIDLPPAPPAPAPLPEVRQPKRGRVDLPTNDLAAEMAADLH